MTREKNPILDIVIDTREQLPWSFGGAVRVTRAALSVGDYALVDDLGFAVERKSLSDLAGSIGSGSGWANMMDRVARMKAAQMFGCPVVAECTYAELIYRYSEEGRLALAALGRPTRMTSNYMDKRCAQLFFLGMPVLFAGDRQHARRMAYRLLRQRYRNLEMEGNHDA